MNIISKEANQIFFFTVYQLIKTGDYNPIIDVQVDSKSSTISFKKCPKMKTASK